LKVLCVQCLKLNDLPDAAPGGDGKVRFPCPNCGFVTVVTRKAAKRAPGPPIGATDSPGPTRPAMKVDLETTPSEPRRPAKSLHDELFDGSEKQIGDWMVRRLDGTEAGPLNFEDLKEMIREGDIGKIDEVRRLDERYVPAAFHELTAELFNELDMAGVAPPKR
jgi:hypothetical protein